jgi:NTP pyrophosphatase (non-canonical NTP hydrolase)
LVPGTATSDRSEFLALKRALQQFTEQRAALPREAAERTALELGELLITLVNMADRLDIDLVQAGERAVKQRALDVPRLVQIARPGETKLS